jgi:uncharacterized protein YidB (DUF937 family)
MGLLDGMMNQVGGMLGGDQNKDLLGAVMGMLGNQQAGGLGGIVKKLTGGGLGDIVSSWVSTGENKPVSPAKLTEALGHDEVQQLADKAGITKEEASSQLSQIFPDVIDKLTPDGKVPDSSALEQGMSLLKSKIFG